MVFFDLINAALKARVGDMTKFTIRVFLFHGNDIYHNIVIFALNKVFMISKFLIEIS